LKLHPRNKHRGRYDFKELISVCPELGEFAALNIYGDESIDFSNPNAVKILNKALLKHFYGIDFWEIPDNYLCPPIPGRADYIHYIADLLAEKNGGKIPTGKQINCLDIGVGANCVYPIIGNREYGWSFIGSDVDPVSIASANKIIENDLFLQNAVECRLQKNPLHIFRGIIQPNEFFDLSICNPPFYASPDEAEQQTLKKLSNLNNKKVMKPIRNFGGQNSELWCEGGEEKFVESMIRESVEFKNSCFWFSTLISKQSNLKSIYATLKIANVGELKTIPMRQGNKISRIVAWTFLDEKQQKDWKSERWKRED
jgi:23S rRNA (adenine1618-N6)-methyltransferase